MQAHLAIQQAHSKTRKQRKELELKLNTTIPSNLCCGTDGLLRQHCRHRKPDNSCRFIGCRYNVVTAELPLIEKEFLSAAYHAKRRS